MDLPSPLCRLLAVLSLLVFSLAEENVYNYGDPGPSGSDCKEGEISRELQGLPNWDACFPECLERNACPTNVPKVRDDPCERTRIVAAAWCRSLSVPRPVLTRPPLTGFVHYDLPLA